MVITLGRRVVPGMEKFVAIICARMAILTAVRYTHFLVTVHTANVIRSFQANLIAVKQSIVSINFVEIFSFEPIACMAPLAGNFISSAAFCMTAHAVFIHDLGPKGMVMADSAVAFSNFLMHCMVKKDRFIKLSQ